MITGQEFWRPGTGARFHVLETSGDGTRGIAAGYRTGGRVLVIEDPRGHWLRQVTDNGRNGTLLDTLNPHGPRYRLRPAS